MTSRPPFGAPERFLMAAHPGLAAVIRQVGPCVLAPHPPAGPAGHYRALVRAIVAQQLSGKAADTIFARVAGLANGEAALSPRALLTVPDETLRGAGLSRSKLASVRDLATRVASGALPLEALETLDDEAVIAQLTPVRGIGRWTAEMFLMFRLCRPDVFPVGDLGIKKGAVRLFRLRNDPDAARLARLAAPFRPHRTVFSWYLWRVVDGNLPEGVLPPPPRGKIAPARRAR